MDGLSYDSCIESQSSFGDSPLSSTPTSPSFLSFSSHYSNGTSSTGAYE